MLLLVSRIRVSIFWLMTPVNPEISSGLPIPTLNRFPQPGSRPERYATPATQASDVAFNPVRTCHRMSSKLTLTVLETRRGFAL